MYYFLKDICKILLSGDERNLYQLKQMNATVSPGKVNGNILIPPSKSLTQRAFAGALLHQGTTRIFNCGTSDDETAALDIIRQLGAAAEKHTTHLAVTSSGISPTATVINCGESGLAARLFTPIIATYDQPITITGKGSLLNRPMYFFDEVLPQLSVQADGQNNRLPVTIKGPLQAKNITVDGSLSSQFITGLLFAYAFTVREEVTIEVTNLTGKPYVDLTLEMLRSFGKNVRHEDHKRFIITPSATELNEIECTVEADWSSAGYWIVAGLINGKISLTGLNKHSLQADKAIMNVVKQCGGNAIWTGNTLHLQSSGSLNTFDFDATHCPDLFPILSIFATQCKGISSIKGLNRLIHKESNRKESICEMLAQFGTSFKIENDTLLIEGNFSLKSCNVPSFNDHRIAMAAAIGALKAKGNVIIKQAECVSKSYPGFFRHLQQSGINTAIER